MPEKQTKKSSMKKCIAFYDALVIFTSVEHMQISCKAKIIFIYLYLHCKLFNYL